MDKKILREILNDLNDIVKDMKKNAEAHALTFLESLHEKNEKKALEYMNKYHGATELYSYACRIISNKIEQAGAVDPQKDAGN